VIRREVVPVALLVFGQHPRTVTDGAHAAESLDNGRSDELRPVWDILNGLQEFIIHFEGNNILLFFHFISPGYGEIGILILDSNIQLIPSNTKKSSSKKRISNVEFRREIRFEGSSGQGPSEKTEPGKRGR
jgi:hypothetical protein